MEVIYERVAGLDVHKDTVVACLRTHLGRTAERECRSFGTTTDELLALRDWLAAAGCQLAAMEATGVYWMPIYKILADGDLTLLVANAAHIKGVSGRKTDMNDAMWIADLAACGLIKASFVPEEGVHEMRTLMRTRKQLVREQTSHAQRIQKTLTEANIRLDSVISDIMGLNGRRMIEAMIGGLRDPRKLAALADRRLKATPKQLYDALHGRLTDHHRFLLKLHLTQWDALDLSVQEIDRQVDARLTQMQASRPADDPELAVADEHVKDEEVTADKARFPELIDLLLTIPGVAKVSALTILSEIGPDMSRFPTAGHGRLGGNVSRPERKRRQEERLSATQGRALAQDHARAMRLGRHPRQDQLLPGSVLSTASPTRATKSYLCGCGFDPRRDLPHDQERNPTP